MMTSALLAIDATWPYCNVQVSNTHLVYFVGVPDNSSARPVGTYDMVHNLKLL